MDQSQFGGILSILGGILAFIVILFLAYFCTKFLAGRYQGIGARGGQIEIIERVSLGPDKMLLIVRAAGKVLLLGATARHIEKLEELDPGRFREKPIDLDGQTDFFSMLRGAMANGFGNRMNKEKDNRDG